jgi:hypothetical protein
VNPYNADRTREDHTWDAVGTGLHTRLGEGKGAGGGSFQIGYSSCQPSTSSCPQ